MDLSMSYLRLLSLVCSLLVFSSPRCHLVLVPGRQMPEKYYKIDYYTCVKHFSTVLMSKPQAVLSTHLLY